MAVECEASCSEDENERRLRQIVKSANRKARAHGLNFLLVSSPRCAPFRYAIEEPDRPLTIVERSTSATAPMSVKSSLPVLKFPQRDDRA